MAGDGNFQGTTLNARWRVLCTAFKKGWLPLFVCFGNSTFAAVVLPIPDFIEVDVIPTNLAASDWIFELKAALASGLQPLSTKTPQYNIRLANLNKTAEGKLQKFDTVPEAGHHRLVLTDFSTGWGVAYSIMITTTSRGCGNMMQRYSDNYYKSTPGRVMEINVFEAIPGFNVVPLVNTTLEVCTNIAGRLRFHFEAPVKDTLPFNVLTFYKDGSLVAAHPMVLNLEWLNVDRMTAVEKKR